MPLAAVILWRQSPASLHQELSVTFPGFQHQTGTTAASSFLELSSSLFSAHPTLSPLERTLGLWSCRSWGHRNRFNPMVTTKQLCRLQMSCSLFWVSVSVKVNYSPPPHNADCSALGSFISWTKKCPTSEASGLTLDPEATDALPIRSKWPVDLKDGEGS